MKNINILKKEKKYNEIIEIYEENLDKNYSLFEFNLILESYYKIKNYKKSEILSNIILT